MKNSASSPLIIPVLRVQAEQLLAQVTATLTRFDYIELSHQRLSQQKLDEKSIPQNVIYQGLTRAKHPKFGDVMVKWELIPKSNHSDFTLDGSQLNRLSHEIEILQAMNLSTLAQDTVPIAPPILDSDIIDLIIDLQALNISYHLSIIVLPYYNNGSLASYLQHNKNLSNNRKYLAMLKAAKLIADLHHCGWLHNDIKPSNFLLDNFWLSNADNGSRMPRLLLTDFVLAHRIDKNNNCDLQLSGTPAYLAPERWQGHGATIQSDVYAFGIMMFEIIMGERPFTINKNSPNKAQAWAIQHCQTPIPKLIKEYSHYQNVINKALAKRADSRYQKMTEVLEDLRLLSLIELKI